MKFILIVFTFLLFLTGCSDKNAFYHFDMTKEQELGTANLKGKKILNLDGSTAGVISTVYLNPIYPDLYNDNEYFYVYMYLTKPKLDIDLKLNKMLPLSKERLNPNNNFTKLTSVQNNWTDYFLVTFAKDNNNTLNLSFENNQSLPAHLKYLKDE